jgi:carbon-monoxide dehydrogenase medium subunit
MSELLPSFVIRAPQRVDEAIDLLREHGEAARVYTGGTELLLVMKAGLLTCDCLVDIKGIADLNQVRRDNGALVIGATATHRAIEQSPVVRSALPELIDVTRQIANARIRASGTLGGNLCFAEPHSDPATFLLAFDTDIECSGAEGSRWVPLDEFFVGAYESAIQPDELLTAIRVQLPAGRWSSAYRRFAVLERPTANVAVRLDADADGTVTDARITVGAVGDKPTRVGAAEARCTGVTVAEVLARAPEVGAAVEGEVEAFEDLYGSDEYKRALAAELTRRAVQEAASRLNGGDRQHG